MQHQFIQPLRKNMRIYNCKNKQFIIINLGSICKIQQQQQLQPVQFMDYQLSRQGQFIISISNKQYKIVKFINGDSENKAQKVFQIQLKNPDQLLHLKSQLQNVKDYLVRLKQLPSPLQLQNSELQILQKENQTHFVVKVNTPFNQHPTLSDFYKKQNVNPIYRIKHDQKYYIYFFEEFFQLMIKGGGIKDFFYTNHNIWMMPSQTSIILEYGKLYVNKTSIVGLKFIKGYDSITKDQFIEIYPSLPPNVFEMMKDKSAQGRAKLELIIKIRSFSFLILTFVLKRIPQLFEQNFKPRIDCGSPQIKNLINKTAERMSKLLELAPIKKEIKEAQRLTKVKLLKFFQTVFVQSQQQDKLDWLFVYKIFFQKNIVNFESYQRSNQSQVFKKENQLYLENWVFFEKIIKQMWEMEHDKNFYIERGFVRNNPFKVNMVYFLVKINVNFHRLLRYLNIAQLARMHRFSEDTHQIVLKLMSIFSHKLEPKNQQNPADIYKIIQQSRSQIRQLYSSTLQTAGNGLTFEQQSDLNIFNPFAFKNQKQQELASKTYPDTILDFPSSPVQFLQKMYTHHVLSSKPPETRGKQQNQITTMSHRLQNIINISNSLWFV